MQSTFDAAHLPYQCTASENNWEFANGWFDHCRKNPLSEFNYDGSSIHPYETMFVPMDTIAIENGWSYAKLAALYETWLTLQVTILDAFHAVTCHALTSLMSMRPTCERAFNEAGHAASANSITILVCRIKATTTLVQTCGSRTPGQSSGSA